MGGWHGLWSFMGEIRLAHIWWISAELTRIFFLLRNKTTIGKNEKKTYPLRYIIQRVKWMRLWGNRMWVSDSQCKPAAGGDADLASAGRMSWFRARRGWAAPHLASCTSLRLRVALGPCCPQRLSAKLPLPSTPALSLCDLPLPLRLFTAVLLQPERKSSSWWGERTHRPSITPEREEQTFPPLPRSNLFHNDGKMLLPKAQTPMCSLPSCRTPSRPPWDPRSADSIL